MNRIYNAAATARNVLFCHSLRNPSNTVTTTNIDRNTHRLDPTVRDVMAQSVQNDAIAIQQQLDEITIQLEEAIQKLQQNEEKEIFLGIRTRHYRKLLDIQAREIKLEQKQHQQQQQSIPTCPNTTSTTEKATIVTERECSDTTQTDNNNNNMNGIGEDIESGCDHTNMDYELRMEKWEHDTEMLEQVIAIHTQILAECEQMRRTIKGLQQKKQSTEVLQQECQLFLDNVSSVVQQQQQHQQPDDGGGGGGATTTATSTGSSLPTSEQNISIDVVTTSDNVLESSSPPPTTTIANTEMVQMNDTHIVDCIEEEEQHQGGC